MDKEILSINCQLPEIGDGVLNAFDIQSLNPNVRDN